VVAAEPKMPHNGRQHQGKRGVYLDGFATMPIAPEAREALLDALDMPANASSPHALGERAASIVANARRDVSALVGCAPAELVFTSGATEADNLAIVGGAAAQARSGDRRRRIIVSAIEHAAVLEPAAYLAEQGFEIVMAPVDPEGTVDVEALTALVDEDCWLVSVMAVNNETGVIQPIERIAEIAHAGGALIHCDAAQALGKISVDLPGWDVDFASLSAHKAYGPVGVGALYVAAGAPSPRPLQLGGGQQAGRRSGTEPTALLAGFGAAAAIAHRDLLVDAAKCADLLGQFLDELSLRQVRYRKISGKSSTVPGGTSISITGCNADDLCARISREVQISTSSACHAGQIRPSHVLNAMGYDAVGASSVFRVMMNRYLQGHDVRRAAGIIAETLQT
jgi:cysteine desulfurase